jgi:hypothetical protein
MHVSWILKSLYSIWHEGLFLKLLENKIDGQFYSLIKSLYSNSKCAIKQNNIRTDFSLILKVYVKDVY